MTKRRKRRGTAHPQLDRMIVIPEMGIRERLRDGQDDEVADHTPEGWVPRNLREPMDLNQEMRTLDKYRGVR